MASGSSDESSTNTKSPRDRIGKDVWVLNPEIHKLPDSLVGKTKVIYRTPTRKLKRNLGSMSEKEFNRRLKESRSVTDWPKVKVTKELLEKAKRMKPIKVFSSDEEEGNEPKKNWEEEFEERVQRSYEEIKDYLPNIWDDDSDEEFKKWLQSPSVKIPSRRVKPQEVTDEQLLPLKFDSDEIDWPSIWALRKRRKSALKQQQTLSSDEDSFKDETGAESESDYERDTSSIVEVPITKRNKRKANRELKSDGDSSSTVDFPMRGLNKKKPKGMNYDKGSTSYGGSSTTVVNKRRPKRKLTSDGASTSFEGLTNVSKRSKRNCNSDGASTSFEGLTNVSNKRVSKKKSNSDEVSTYFKGLTINSKDKKGKKESNSGKNVPSVEKKAVNPKNKKTSKKQSKYDSSSDEEWTINSKHCLRRRPK